MGMAAVDLDLIFKVTPALCQILTKKRSASYVLNLMMDFGQNLCIVSFW